MSGGDLIKFPEKKRGKPIGRNQPGRPRHPWDQIFAYYFALGPTRSYIPLAEHFGVSVKMIRTYASRHKWTDKVREMDAKALEIAQAGAVRAWAVRLEDRLKTIDLACGEFLDRVKRGEVKLNAREFIDMLKVEAQLAGLPQRLEVEMTEPADTRRSQDRLLALLEAAREAGLLEQEIEDAEIVSSE